MSLLPYCKFPFTDNPHRVSEVLRVSNISETLLPQRPPVIARTRNMMLNLSKISENNFSRDTFHSTKRSSSYKPEFISNIYFLYNGSPGVFWIFYNQDNIITPAILRVIDKKLSQSLPHREPNGLLKTLNYTVLKRTGHPVAVWEKKTRGTIDIQDLRT